MKRRTAITLGLVFLLLLALILGHGVLAQSGGDYDVEWHVMGTAGDEFVAGGNYQVGFTLGQDQEPGFSSGGDYQIAQGYWAGGGFQPTAAELIDFHVEPRGHALVVLWETASEIDTLGFNLYRSEGGEPGTFEQLNPELIPAQMPGSPLGTLYEWVDAAVDPGQPYYYLLEDVDVYGQTNEYGPIMGVAPYRPIFLPLVMTGK